HARVVEVDEVRTVIGPQDVSRVAIAVEAEGFCLSRSGVAGIHELEGLHGSGLPGVQEIGGNEAALQKPLARPAPEGLRRERLALLERPRGADRVNASQEAADPLERLG